MEDPGAPHRTDLTDVGARPGSLEVFHRAATPVRTDSLTKSGVEKLRILSESRFLQVLEEMVESSLAGRVGTPPSPAATPGRADATGIEELYSAKWEDLRDQHKENLSRIEGRMERLSKLFESISSAFERIHGASPRLPAAKAPDHLTLLRQMML
ncbi:MAG TPA: hypothetical protein VMT52_16120 [Planctomycetota bacterium]|nr:hypothetical protein [Planctomycetota bacterium]